MKFKDLKINKRQVLKSMWKIFLVVLGTLILAFGSGVFLVPFEIISGGITGIAILISDFIDVDITAYILTWGLFFIGLLVLGFKFSLTTLISTILYPLFLSLFLRTGFAQSIVRLLLSSQDIELLDSMWNNGAIIGIETLVISDGLLLIVGVIGGACVGLGCSLTFLGGGSTGGLDIISFILNKYTGLKTSISFFTIDATIVGVGLILDIVNQNGFKLVAGLIGIISAFICSLMIEIIYVSKEKAYNVDIISDKYDEFIKFSIEKLDRSATIFDVVGGYSEENKKMVRITFNRTEYIKVKDAIAQIDPKAFATFSQAILVGGEGFSRIQKSNTNSIKTLQKAIKNKKNEE